MILASFFGFLCIILFSSMRWSAPCLNPMLEGQALNLGYATLGRLANASVAVRASSLWGTRFWLPISYSYGETSRLVENTIIHHDDSAAHSGCAVKNVPRCWRGSVANTVLILQISFCDYDLIPLLKHPLHGNDLQIENTF